MIDIAKKHPLRIKKTPSYPRGAGPDGRRYAMAMQLAALEAALAPWPRRQSPMLEVNCGNGAFLRFLWQCGFDVQGAEADPDLRVKAQNQPVPGLEICAAADDDLPFENDSFDWVIAHLKSGEPRAIAACANEGTRLAKRGFLITFWNNASLPALAWKLAHKKSWAENSTSWWQVWKLLRGMKLGRVATISTLYFPIWTWKGQKPSVVFSTLPLGAWCAVRLDLGASAPATPLPLRLGATLARAEPVLGPYNNGMTRDASRAKTGG